MSRFAISLPVLLFAIAGFSTAAPVPAGPKLAEEPVPFSVAKLLKHRKIQQSLKMTAEQRINLHDALEDIEDEYIAKIEALEKQPTTPEEAFEKLEKERLKLVEKVLTASANKDLLAAQRLQLRQTGWRIQGPAAFADEFVQKKLQLTDAQKKAAADLTERTRGFTDKYLNVYGNPDEQKVREEILEFRKETVQKFMESLSADQKDLWKGMLGDPIKGFNADEFWFKIVLDDDLDSPN